MPQSGSPIAIYRPSWGTGVPVMEFKHSRGETELEPWYAEMGEDGVHAFWQRKNTETIDGKPTHIFDDA